MSARAPALPGGSGRRSESGLRGRLLVVVWIGVPAVCLLVAGLVGTQLDSHSSVVGTVGVFALLLVGCPVTVLALSRALLRSGDRERAKAALRIRRPQMHQMLPPPPLAAAPSSAPVALGSRRRAAAVGMLAVMFATSLAVWTLVPLSWLWLGSQLASTTRPELEPYLVILVGIPLTMAALVKVLYRLDAVYGRLTRRGTRGRARAAWLKSLSAERARRPTTAADNVMWVSVVVALVCLLVWFMVLAPHHSVMEWYMD